MLATLVAASALLAGLTHLNAVNAQTTTTTAASGVCNGHAELCSRSYGNISYVGAHNSYSVAEGSIAANQNFDVTTQLQNGIRMLQNQGHDQDGAIHLCHSSCLLLDAGTLQNYLQDVKNWLDENPNEVITILWVNQGNIPVTQWAEAYTATGMDALSYTPTTTPVPQANWPTLTELISSGKRVVTFMDYGADYSSVPYILDHFTHFWENPYDQTDPTFPCTIDRGSADTGMYMINHYLDKNMTFFGSQIPVPDTAALEQTNAASGAGSLGQSADECAAQHGRYPTFMLVDFYDIVDGSVFQAAANLNGVQYSPIAMGNGTSTSRSKSNSSSAASPSSSLGAGRSGSISSTSNTDTGAASANVELLGKTAMSLLAVAASVVVFA